jgi:polyisoprenyl-phosphate glycosyltransferase
VDTLSIVVPVYCNQQSLPESLPKLLALESEIPEIKLELIFVDDGSKDASLHLLKEQQEAHPDIIKVVKLARNFGAVSALRAGLSQATGDCQGVISADLQDPPELFLDMVRHWRNGYKVVYAVRQGRQDRFLDRAFSGLYYRLLRLCSFRDYPDEGFDVFLMDRQVATEVGRLKERNTHLQLLVYWLGYESVRVPYHRRKREKGKSGWSLFGKLKLAIDGITGFSYLPIRWISACGMLAASVSFLYGTLLILNRLVWGIEVKGFAALGTVLAFGMGAQMTMLGVLGEYLWRALDEIKGRPEFVVDHVYEGPSHEA